MLNHKFIGNQSSKTVIIFLHEGLGCIEMWNSYPNELCKALNGKGLIYDRAGYGKSEGSLVNRQSDYLHLGALELFDLVQDLELSNHKIILYGHSDGGSIALIFAAKYPNIVNAVITEAAHVFVEPETLNGIAPALNAFKEGKLNGLKKHHGNRFEEVFYAWVNIWNHPSFLDWNIEKELATITCPQLIIQGKDDQYGTLKQIESIKANTVGKTTLLVPEDCGHSPFKEKEAEVLSESVKFIKKHH